MCTDFVHEPALDPPWTRPGQSRAVPPENLGNHDELGHCNPTLLHDSRRFVPSLGGRPRDVAGISAGRPVRRAIQGREVRATGLGRLLVANDGRFTVPLFTIDEAAHHVGLPPTTLKDWTRRQAGPAPLVHRIVNPSAPRAASLPFVAVVEAHMLRGFRDLGLSAQGLRDSARACARGLVMSTRWQRAGLRPMTWTCWWTCRSGASLRSGRGPSIARVPSGRSSRITRSSSAGGGIVTQTV